MQDIYKDLMLLEDEQEEQDKDLVLDMIDSLTHFYVEEEDETSRKVPWYCMLSDVASDFGYSDKEMMDFAKNNGYIVFKISPIGSFKGGLAIADKDVDLDMVKENVRKSVVDDFENEKDIPEVKISFEKERKVEESKLDDLKVSSYKYLLDVYDRDDNFIERKFFRSRPEADKFVDAMTDLFDIKISNNEVVELKDGKDFFGTYWKVIRELNKDESLKEDAKEIPWVMQQGENGELEYLGFAKSHNDMISKLVKSHSSDAIGENTYINELDKDTYLSMKKEGTIDEEDIKLLDSYFNVKESLREDTDTELVGKPIKFKDESCEITEVKEEDDDAFISLSNGKKVSAKIGVNKGILSSEDAFVQAYLDTFKEDEAEEPEEEPTVKVDSKEEIINQALEDAREDWYKHKKNSPMYKTINQAFKKNDFSNVPSADPVLYATTYKKEFERLKDSVEGKLAKNYVGVIEKTYKGDVDELIAWLKDAVTNISVTSGDAMTNSVEDRVKFFNDRDSTNVEVQYQDRKVWSSWKASLTDKEEVLSRMPKEVLTWSIDKNSGTTIDDVELGLVYNQRQNKITSNPVVLDMLYEYGFNLGKQKVQKSSSEVKGESLNESNEEEVVEETNEYKIVKTIETIFKTVNGVARKDKDKVIYQVYFRTQDYNPAVGRWMNRGWTNSTSEHGSIESARAYVKRYGKTLKDELEEALEHPELYGKKVKIKVNNALSNTIDRTFGDNIIEKNVLGKNEIEYILPYDSMFEYIAKRFHKNYEVVECLEEDIEKHDTLNQKLFDGEELKPVVAKAIMNIANEFVKELGEDGISFTLKDVILLGSNMSYNYTKDSDLDIHLIADSSALECPKELQDKLYSAYRTIFNKNYDITIKGIPAEVYVELDEPQAKSNGIYSLNSGWVKKPEQQAIPDLDKEAFDEFFKFWEDRYNELINNENATSKDVEEYINDIYDERKDGIANDGEYSLGNLLFKEVRNKGYLDNLKDLRKELKGKELSLEQLDNSTKEKYNNVEEKFMNKRYKKPIKEETKENMLKKYHSAYTPEIDSKTGLPILPDELFGDWEY